MEISRTKLPGVLILTPEVFADERGSFSETWNRRQFREAGLEVDFVQDSESLSRGGVLRGLHFQHRKPQGKLVRVASGKVFDVTVDLRRSSPTFGQWIGETLSDENHRMLWVPAGFAHGFLVLSTTARVLYKTTDLHMPSDEGCIAWNDPDLSIHWPLPSDASPLLSERDRNAARMSNSDHFP